VSLDDEIIQGRTSQKRSMIIDYRVNLIIGYEC
jgi:hypothetical protein